MPALKMKAKSSTDCVKQGHNLHACHKSTKISKGSRSPVKTSQGAAHTSIQKPHDASLNIEVPGQNVVHSEANDHQETSTQILKLPLSSSDSTSIGRMGSLLATCPSTVETIFSPTFEHNEVHFKPIDHSNEVRDDEHAELPHLVADDSDDGSSSSSDFQIHNLSDIYISESDVALPFDRDMGFSDVITTDSHDYEYVNPDMMFDLEERYMILPFHEKTVETHNIHYEESIEEAVMNSEDVCSYLAIHQMKSSEYKTEMSHHSGDLEEVECFDPQLFIRNIPDLSEAVSSIWPVWLPKETWKGNPITLVLDLDETLVHSTLDHCDDADFTFPVFSDMKLQTVYVRRRPYLQMFLERVAQMFEIVIFTASLSIYAEQLLDILDPDRKLISRRIYRESCIFSDGNYTKDLTILGVDLSKVAIIDNSPQVFRLQVDNGIPIKSWFDDPSDHALISLLPFLETLVDADDVRPIIAKRFSNKE